MTSPELRFEGKLIDVESGEIVASIDLAFSVADASDTNVKVGQNSQEVRLSGEGPRDRVVNAVLTQLADIIAKGPPRKVASADEPKAEVPPATPQAGTPEKAESKKKPVR